MFVTCAVCSVSPSHGIGEPPDCTSEHPLLLVFRDLDTIGPHFCDTGLKSVDSIFWSCFVVFYICYNLQLVLLAVLLPLSANTIPVFFSSIADLQYSLAPILALAVLHWGLFFVKTWVYEAITSLVRNLCGLLCLSQPRHW